MPQKLGYSPANNAKERGHVSFGTVSNATAREAVFDCSDIDTLSLQVTCGGTLTGTITVLASNSFIPGSADPLFGAPLVGSGTPIRAGTWVAITARCTGITNPAGSGSDSMIAVSVATDPLVTPLWVMVRFVQSGGSGAVDVYASGKTIGR
jgi:hypothetical protein